MSSLDSTHFLAAFEHMNLAATGAGAGGLGLGLPQASPHSSLVSRPCWLSSHFFVEVHAHVIASTRWPWELEPCTPPRSSLRAKGDGVRRETLGVRREME